MTRPQSSPRAGSHHSRVRRVQVALGGLGVLVVLAAWSTGALGFLERLTIDARARTFGFFSGEPSDRVVVVAIDQAALDNIQRWPWDRARLASIVRELTIANASVIALDLLLDDPQQPRAVRAPDGSTIEIRDDQLLADAMRESGRVIAASGFPLGVSADQAAALAPGAGAPAPSPSSGASSPQPESLVFRLPLARVYAALAQRPELVSASEEDALRELAPLLLPESSRGVTQGPELRELRRQVGVARTMLRAAPGSTAPSSPETSRFPSSTRPNPSVPMIADAATTLANVSFDSFDTDFKVRRVPLLVEHQGRLWPSLGLAAAQLHMMRTAPPDARAQTAEIAGLGAASVQVRRADNTALRIPLKAGEAGGLRREGLMFVPWPRSTIAKPAGLSGWQWQFYNAAQSRPAEVPLGLVYEPVALGEAVAANLGTLEQLLRAVYLHADHRMFDAPVERRVLDLLATLRQRTVGDEAWLRARADLGPLLDAAHVKARETLAFWLDGVDRATLTKDELAPIVAVERAAATIPALLTQIDRGVTNIDKARRLVRERVDGRICFVGWTATGAVADFVSTSIDPKTPGVHVHAAVANSVLTGLTRTQGPLWLDTLLIVALGALGALLGVRAGVVTGLFVVAGVIAGWFVVVGLGAWDALRLIVSFEGPALACAAGALVVYVHRLLVEQRARRRTEERFKSYVSPKVVDILVNNPELDSMRPTRKELSIMFTDLAGFTTTAERLGSVRTAEVLAAYLGSMTETIQQRSATLDKYIGDAIVAFWGAPVDNPTHARDACLAALDMIKRLDAMNASGSFDDVGPRGLEMRVGLAAGEVMVGDFGNPPRNSSYTVLGDTANLASRLEGANKAFGSRILCSAHLRRLALDQGLDPALRWRAIGRVRVKGKVEPIDLFELVGDLTPLGPNTGAWVDATNRAVELFEAAKVADARAAFEALARDFGASPLTERALAALEDAARPPEPGTDTPPFDGCITLDEK
jgi:class 3 adenylate cyclase/CHASE2 domain-containing sensor protein